MNCIYDLAGKQDTHHLFLKMVLYDMSFEF